MATLITAVAEKMQGSYATLQSIYDTSRELMDQGALPDVERGPNPDNKKSDAVNRHHNVRDVLGAHGANMWAAMHIQECKHACHNLARKYGTNERSANGHACTHCEKPAHACSEYVVLGAEWSWKPIAELADEKARHVVRVCSTRCEHKLQAVLICLACNTHAYTKAEAQSYPCPHDRSWI